VAGIASEKAMTNSTQDWRSAPCRPNDLPPMDLRVQRAEDGSVWLQHGQELASFEPTFLSHLRRQAEINPDKVAYARRGPGGAVNDAPWESISYAELLAQVLRIAAWFGARNAQGEVLLLLTGNSIAHAVLRLGAMVSGVVICPVSAAYVAAGGDFARLSHVLELVKPKYLFAEAEGDAAAAKGILQRTSRTLIVATRSEMPQGFADVYTLAELLKTAPDATDPEVGADAPAAYMLTSGSTGRPKAVCQSQRMILSNLHQAWQILGQAAGWSDRMLDWLPWSHVSGAFNLYAAAVFGGSLYIDDGKPVAGLFEETIANLRSMSLRYFCNVPLGYGMLVEALQRDAELREVFFRDLRLMLYGGAGLSQPVMDALQGMAVQTCDHRITMTTGYGLTESSSGCMAIYFPTDKVGIGLPLPGVETRLVPLEDDRYEIRLRGPNVMAGYLNNPEASADAFDEEGCFRTGDAARFHEASDPEQGLAYAGRLVEEFKLNSGTWVQAGAVRAELLAALAPLASDVLLCGINRDYLAALLVPNVPALTELVGSDEPLGTGSQINEHAAVQTRLAECLANYNRVHPGNSTAVRRLAFMAQLPDPQRHEISDKGTINQRIAAEHREAEIETLYATTPPSWVLEAG